MALTTNADVHQLNKELYAALTGREKDKVIQLCRRIPEGPLHIVTVHDDTVLHMAAYSKQNDLVLHLLQMVPESDYNKLMHQNDIGDTILHEAATASKLIPAAGQILHRAPALLRIKNNRGETAIFRASHYGKSKMFDFLDEEFNKDVQSEEELKAFHQRNDKATILHMSVGAERFELALQIARRYKYLVGERDGNGMTALQLLAGKPSAFYSGRKHGHIKRFIYSCLSTEVIPVQEEGQPHCRVPLWESIRMQKRRYESALQLAKFLIERDTSWESTETRLNRFDPRTHKYGMPNETFQSQGQGNEKKAQPSQAKSEIKIAATPLILATKSGCLEIVQEILNRYPQAIEHVDDEGRNILHIAIKYRQIHIFDIIEKREIPMRRLIRKLDNQGNSILHMVGIKKEPIRKLDNQRNSISNTVGIKKEHQTEDLRNPALLLQESLVLFERVMKTCTTDYVKLINANRQTAEQLFASSNAELHLDAKEWLKRTAENCSIVAVLIATVAFAAAYTVPGGSNDKTGYPILMNRPFFIIFTIADVLSITFALTSVITFLSILTSPFQLIDFRRSLPQALIFGVTLLILSVSMMMLAFAATIILTINHKGEWTKIALYSVAFLPVSIFTASYFPLYGLMWKTFKESQRKLWEAFPRCSNDFVRRCINDPVHSSTGIDSPTKDEASGFTASSFSLELEDCGYSV